MWILPKNHSLACHYSQDMTASESELKKHFRRQRSRPSLMSRSKPMPLRTVLRKWKQEGWFQLLCGRMLRRSMRSDFETRLISLLEDTHASHFQPQESERGKKTPGICGPTLEIPFKRYSPKSVFLKTSKATSLSDSEKSLPIWLSSDIGWKTIVASQRGEYSRRLRSAHRTNGNGCLSWPTATARDHMGPRRKLKNGENVSGKGVRFGMDLNQSVQKWATPETQNSTGYQNQKNGTKTARLGSQVLDGRPVQENLNMDGRSRESLATPQSRDHRSGHPDRWENVKERSRNLNDQQMVVNGKLNPSWVEQLMGLPVGWTQLSIGLTASDSSETESYPKQQKKHSEPCGVAS